MGRPGDDGATEWVNREQLDEGQAQDVAEDARNRQAGLGESSHGGKANPAQIIPDDVPDIVAVSYTHLDVYKRQAQLGFLGWAA